MYYRMITADNHYNEPSDIFTKRVPASLRDAAPRRVPTPDGGEGWMINGVPPKVSSHNFQSMVFYQNRAWKPEEYKRMPCKHEDMAKGSWDPKSAVEEMRKDGTDASVWYPGTSVVRVVLGTDDPVMREAAVRAYNDWQAEFCAHDPDRLIGMTLLPTDEETPDKAIAEMLRGKKIGLRGALLSWMPKRRMWDRWWDPLWAAAQDADIAIHFHKGCGTAQHSTGIFGERDGPGQWSAGQIQSDMTYAVLLGDFIFGGVFDRFPRLKLVAEEGRIGWLGHFAERGDVSYNKHRFQAGYELKKLPSEYVRANTYHTFLEDRAGILLRDMIGVDNVMWSSDYPHSDSTWPNSVALNERQFAGIPEEDKRKLLALNAARLYGLPADEFKQRKAA